MVILLVLVLYPWIRLIFNTCPPGSRDPQPLVPFFYNTPQLKTGRETGQIVRLDPNETEKHHVLKPILSEKRRARMAGLVEKENETN